MATFLVQLGDLVVEWSTCWDAPVTPGMTRDELVEYIRRRYGEQGLEELPARLARLDAKGTSAFDERSAEDAVWLNRAGPNEARLTFEQLVEWAKESRRAA